MATSEPLRWKDEEDKEGGIRVHSQRDSKEQRRGRVSKDIENIYHEEIGGFEEKNPWLEGKQKEKSRNLPEPSEEQGMGDILYGLFPEPDADPVQEVKDVWDHA